MKKPPALLLAFALSLGVAGACSDDGGDSAAADASTTTSAGDATTSTTAGDDATTTTADEATTTTEAPVDEATTTTGDVGDDGPAIPTDPEEYAQAFVDAWATGDMPTAAVLGTEDAVISIFSLEGGGSWSVETCEGAAGSTYCTFTAGGSARLIVRVINEVASQAGPQAVTEVRLEN